MHNSTHDNILVDNAINDNNNHTENFGPNSDLHSECCSGISMEQQLKKLEILLKQKSLEKAMLEIEHQRIVNKEFELNYSLKNLSLKLEIMETIYTINPKYLDISFDELLSILEKLGANSKNFEDIREIHDARIKKKREIMSDMFV